MEEINKRITYKRARPNPIFQEWLEELYSEAKSKKSKIESLLGEALESLSKYPLPLNSGAECAILKGFDKKLCLFLDKRLEVYNTLTHISESSSFQSVSSTHSNETPENDSITRNQAQAIPQNNIQPINDQPSNPSSQTNENTEPNQRPQKKRQPKTYKPVPRSGGYALLIALLEFSRENPNNTIKKEDLIEIAQKHSDESFIRPKPETFYTAWSSMQKLLTKNLVTKVKKKKVEYSLTDAGKTLALQLSSEITPNINNIIFNNASQQSSDTQNSNEEQVQDSQNFNDIVTARLNSNNTPTSTSSQPEIVELSPGSFDVVLLVDKCETGGLTKKNEPMIAQINKYPDMRHDFRSLKVGDFTWIARHKTDPSKELVLPYIIERKRMDDLGGSIKDGRFHEQKFRLRKCRLENVIYLVENYGSNKYVGLPLQSLMQALSNTRIVDGFMVHVTDSLSHTVRFLAMMTKRLTIEYKDKCLKGCNTDPQGEMLMTFDYFNKSSAKNKPLTVTDTFIKLLLQLKGVSVEKALAITKVYPTPSSLIKAYQSCSKKEGEVLLSALKPVGPKISKAIYHLFNIQA